MDDFNFCLISVYTGYLAVLPLQISGPQSDALKCPLQSDKPHNNINDWKHSGDHLKGKLGQFPMIY